MELPGEIIHLTRMLVYSPAREVLPDREARPRTAWGSVQNTLWEKQRLLFHSRLGVSCVSQNLFVSFLLSYNEENPLVHFTLARSLLYSVAQEGYEIKKSIFLCDRV